MLLTWRSTVFSLRNSSLAMARLVLPAATRRSTCTSRAVKPAGWRAGVPSASASTRARSGAAPRRSKTARAASRSSAAPSSSPTARQPRVRRLPAGAGPKVDLLGGGRLAAQAVDLGLLVQGVAARAGVRARQARGRAARLLDRLGPGAAQLHDLRAMDQAARAERDQLRLPLPPPGHRGRPLAGTIRSL